MIKILAGLTVTGLMTSALITAATPATSATPPLCLGKPATIVGKAGNDIIIGQTGVADVIVGLGGNDQIIGGDWYGEDDNAVPKGDVICAGPGDDNVQGSRGNDQISGGGGNDYIDAIYGADNVRGDGDNDILYEDYIEGSDALPDILRGGPGVDRISVALGRDQAFGDAGNDFIIDQACDTSLLYGGPGDDKFWSAYDYSMGDEVKCTSASGAEPDYIRGNDGNDDAVEINKADFKYSIEWFSYVD